MQSQRVVVNGQYSEWLPIASDVPQGSILGPLLFILYTDDVRYIVKHSSIKFMLTTSLFIPRCPVLTIALN